MPRINAAAQRQREERFATAYVRTLNASVAAREAGYSSATSVANLLARPRVRMIIEAKQAGHLQAMDVDALRVKEELARIAFLDPAGCVSPEGVPLHVHQMPPAVRAAVKSIRIICRDGKPVVSTVEFWSKTEAIKLAMQHLALLAPKELTVTHRFPHAELSDAQLKQKLLEAAQTIEVDAAVVP